MHARTLWERTGAEASYDGFNIFCFHSVHDPIAPTRYLETILKDVDGRVFFFVSFRFVSICFRDKRVECLVE